MTPFSSRSAAEFATSLYRKSGYVRVPVPGPEDDRRTYKKGWEVRLVCATDSELRQAQAAARVIGFNPGRPFLKSGRFVVPIYGLEAVEWFVERAGFPEDRERLRAGLAELQRRQQRPRRKRRSA